MPALPPTIETSRLRLRPFTLQDVGPSYEMNLDPEVSRYTGDGGVISRAELERRIREDVLGDYAKYGYGRLAVEWKATGEWIGFAGLKYLPDLGEVDLGYRFLRRFWGKGIATEASRACLDYGFETLGLQRIIALVLHENAASIRVVEKLGFRYEKDIEEDGLWARQYVIERAGD